jgi:hypothetical protein
MAQSTDFTLSNQAFGSFRTELNSILSAVNSCQSGTTTPPSAVAGTIWLDTTSATTPTLKYYDGADNISLATIDHVGNTVNWLDSAVSITGLTTTATGTVLTLNDTNLNSTVSIRIPTSKGIDDDSGNEFLKFTKTASAVNEFTIINSATGNAPEIQATGGDTNIDLKITPKGSGKINLDGIKFPNADGSANQALVTDGSGSLSFATIATFNTPLAIVGDATAGSEIRLPEDTDNGSNYVALKAPNTLASNLTLTLPSADGTANQLLKTDGSGNLSFTTPSAGFSGATTTSSAVDITLTNLSTQTHNVTMTAADKAVILPDATTMTTKGFPAFVIVNDGVYPFSIKNNGGAVIVTVSPANSVELNLISNSTSNGIFSKEDAPINITSTPFTTVKTGTTGCPAITYAYGQFKLEGISVSAISSTSAIITYHAGTSNRDIYGVVVSYSGSTITVNSETLLYSGTSTASINSQGLMLDATNGFLFVQRASNHVVVPFTISGTTISVGTTSSTFGTGTSLANSLVPAITMTSTEALLAARNDGANPTFVLRNIIHNGASAPTIGTASSAITVNNASYAICTLSKIDSTNAFIAYKAASTAYTVARVITISSSSAPTLQTANTSSVVDLSVGVSINIFKVSSTEFIVLGQYGSENYTVSGTTVSYTGSQLHSAVNSLESSYVHTQTTQYMALGNAILSNGREASTGFVIRTKLGSYFHVKQKSILLSQSFYTNEFVSAQAAAWTELDSTTGIAVTNNNNSTTISATIIKYIGS